MTSKEVLQHPILDGITKVVIGVSAFMLTTVLGDISEMKREQAVTGQQVSYLYKTVESRSKQGDRIVAVELGKASKDQLQALKDQMVTMNADLLKIIEEKFDAIRDNE